MTAKESDIEFIIEKLKESSKGLSDNDIGALLPSLNVQQRVFLLNQLIKKGCVSLFSQPTGFLYRWKGSKPDILKGADAEEEVVYEIIKSAGNKGIWVRDIRIRSNLTAIQLNKILKSLQNKKSIKCIKTVSVGKKKVYMLYDLEPDCSLTGGAWYSDQDFESEFVDLLSQQCHRFLVSKREKSSKLAEDPAAMEDLSYATPKEVLKFIEELKISKVQLSEKDITSILNVLVYDDKAISKEHADGNNVYRVAFPLMPFPGITRVPCGVCPVFNDCDPSSLINPTNCEYLLNWVS